jgi:hypothetical protein
MKGEKVMQVSEKTIDPLDKVELDLEAIPQGEKRGADASVKARLAFICGIGVAGLTPFEHLLLGKAADQGFSLRVEADPCQGLLGHLQCTVLQALSMAPPFDLKVKIRSVVPAGNREVVKAMADLGGCGGGCDCGCGG